MDLGDMFTMSKHALERALDMQLDGDTIRKCLTRPEWVTACRQYPDCDLYQRGDITISVVRATGVVATILWRTDKAWKKDLQNRPGYGGRSYRGRAS